MLKGPNSDKHSGLLSHKRQENGWRKPAESSSNTGDPHYINAAAQEAAPAVQRSTARETSAATGVQNVNRSVNTARCFQVSSVTNDPAQNFTDAKTCFFFPFPPQTEILKQRSADGTLNCKRFNYGSEWTEQRAAEL